MAPLRELMAEMQVGGVHGPGSLLHFYSLRASLTLSIRQCRTLLLLGAVG
jgi:hypothetical protein